jgi:hypothetical protein
MLSWGRGGGLFVWRGVGVVEVGIGWEGGGDSEEGEMMIREGRLFGLFLLFLLVLEMCFIVRVFVWKG